MITDERRREIAIETLKIMARRIATGDVSHETGGKRMTVFKTIIWKCDFCGHELKTGEQPDNALSWGTYWEVDGVYETENIRDIPGVERRNACPECKGKIRALHGGGE